LIPKVNIINAADTLDEGELTTFKIDTKRQIDDLIKEVDTKVATLVDAKN